VVERTAEQMDAMIKNGDITDSFTLSAWIMYKDKRNVKKKFRIKKRLGENCKSK